MDSIEVNTQIAPKEYGIFMLKFFYRRPSSWIVVFISLMFVINGITSSLIGSTANPVYIVVGLVLLIFFPWSVYNRNIKMFSTTKLAEPIIYKFEKSQYSLTGESFTSNNSWEKVQKVKENADWFLIYQSKNQFSLIPKKAFTEAQYSELKTLLKSIPNVRLKLQG